jgi:hypothetical protein
MISKNVTLQQMLDEHWREIEPAMKEIADLVITGMPKTERQSLLVRRVCAIVVAETVLRQERREDLE